jgi:hypothetical protein
MAGLKKLPIGLQAFEDFGKENCIYVDKTDLIYSLVKDKGVYFLSRPRRFGKSLLLSTIKAIFEGKRELFKGLAIDQTDYSWQQHPVILLSMSTISTKNYHDISTLLQKMLKKKALEHAVTLTPSSPSQMLMELVHCLHEKYKQSVVVLIDEYDKPILDTISQPEALDDVRQELHNFYVVLKDLDPHLRFLLLTGVSRFSRTSIFSGLNQLADLSSDHAYNRLCGYTDEEVDHYLKDYIDVMKEEGVYDDVREQLRVWYDGYRFHHRGTPLYNPFSIMSALQQKELKNYWFSSGTPTFLVELLRKNHFDLQSLDHLVLSSRKMFAMGAEKLDMIPVLYQTGYATIKRFDQMTGIYRLSIPNAEVRQSLFDALLEDYVQDPAYTIIYSLLEDIKCAVLDGDFDRLIEHLKVIYAKIPYTVHIELERYYQTIFYMIFLLAGFEVIVEEATNDGRIDIVVATPTYRYIIELKLNKTAEEAMKQIKDKGYSTKYADDQRAIVLLGINFNSKTRMIDGWLCEEIKGS